MASRPEPNTATTRLDKWLWAARFYKTRQIAIDAILAGRVEVNGERAKPAKSIRVGDALSIRKPPFSFHISVQQLAEKRGAARIAQTMYAETAESIAAREQLRAEIREMPAPVFRGRPTKRDRRTMEKFMDQQGDDA